MELTSVVRHNRETASFSPTPTVTAGETGEERRGESRGQERKQSSEKLLLEKQLLEQCLVMFRYFVGVEVKVKVIILIHVYLFKIPNGAKVIP